MYSTLAEAQAAELLEEQRQEAAQRRLALALVESAERWPETLRSTTMNRLVLGLLIAIFFSLVNAELVGLAVSVLWFGVLIKTDVRPSCCRTTGGIACVMAMIAMLTMPGPGVLATPFFALPLCKNASGGALYGLHPSGSGLTSADACAQATARAENTPIDIPLALHALDLDRAYRPVVLLPAGGHMSLMLSVLDASGHTIYLPTKLELGPGDSFPWDKALAKPGATVTAITAAGSTIPSTIPSATGSSSSFAASTRRRLLSVESAAAPPLATERPTQADRATEGPTHHGRNTIAGRRLRGFGMGGMRMGGMGGGGFGAFSRGTGSFGSPHRGISQGPSGFGSRGGVASAMGRRGPSLWTQAGAVGRPGASYYHNTPYAGGGYYPSMGYHPSLGFDIATGMMIGHMLHSPRYRRNGPAPALHSGLQQAGTATTDEQQLLLAPPPYRLGSYYYAANVLNGGSVLSVANLTTRDDESAERGSSSASSASSMTNVQRAKAPFRELHSSYDRNAIVEELRTPADASLWPLTLRITDVAFTPNAATTATTPPPPPDALMSLQVAGPPRLAATIHRRRLARLLRFASSMLLLLLALIAVQGIHRQQLARLHDHNDDGASDGGSQLSEMEMGPILPSSGGGSGGSGGVPTGGGVVAPPGPGQPFVSADGEILTVGSRVQTQHSAAYGGDGSWYAGAILTLHEADRTATIIYDDGEEWTAPQNEIFVLQGDAHEEALEQGGGAVALVPERETVAAPHRDHRSR